MESVRHWRFDSQLAAAHACACTMHFEVWSHKPWEYSSPWGITGSSAQEGLQSQTLPLAPAPSLCSGEASPAPCQTAIRSLSQETRDGAPSRSAAVMPSTIAGLGVILHLLERNLAII